MNTENKQFIEDFRKRTEVYGKYTAQMLNIHQKKIKVNTTMRDLHLFLNNQVMAHSTSSLVKTDVVLPQSENRYGYNNSDFIVTINHKGIGTLRVNKTGSNGGYGTTFSEPINANEMLTILTTPEIRDAIKTDLLKKNSFKILRYFNDVCAAEKELKELSEMNDKYKRNIKYDMNISEPVYYTEMGTAENDGRSSITKMQEIIIKSLTLQDGTIIYTNLDDADMENDYRVEEDKEAQKFRFEASEIETAMFLMQIPDEFQAMLNDIEAKLDIDCKRVDDLIGTVQGRLAVYSVMNSLN